MRCPFHCHHWLPVTLQCVCRWSRLQVDQFQGGAVTAHCYKAVLCGYWWHVVTEYNTTELILISRLKYQRKIVHAFAVILLIFFKINFLKNYFRNTIRVSNSLEPDQDWHSVGPDLAPNCLHRLSAHDKLYKLWGHSSSWLLVTCGDRIQYHWTHTLKQTEVKEEFVFNSLPAGGNYCRRYYH